MSTSWALFSGTRGQCPSRCPRAGCMAASQRSRGGARRNSHRSRSIHPEVDNSPAEILPPLELVHNEPGHPLGTRIKEVCHGSLTASAGSRQAATGRCLVTRTLGPRPRQEDANMTQRSGELRAQFGHKSERFVQASGNLRTPSLVHRPNAGLERRTGASRAADRSESRPGRSPPPCAGRVASARSGHHQRRRVHHRG